MVTVRREDSVLRAALRDATHIGVLILAVVFAWLFSEILVAGARP